MTSMFFMGFCMMLGIGIHAAAKGTEFPLPQTGAAMAIVVLMQLLKISRFPWLNENAGRAGAWASAMLSLLAGAGIHIGFDMQTGTLTMTGLTGLTLTNLQGMLGDSFQVYAASELFYKKLLQRRSAP